MNRVRKALTIGGPTFIHSLYPKGWHDHPMYSHELGEMAIKMCSLPLIRGRRRKLSYYGQTNLVEGRTKRAPVREYLNRQGRFAHFTDEDVDYFQSKVDEMWEKWLLPKARFPSPKNRYRCSTPPDVPSASGGRRWSSPDASNLPHMDIALIHD